MKNILCMLLKHKWEEIPDLDSDWGGVLHAYYCKRCGLIKHVTFNNTHYFYRYYVEWFAINAKGVYVEYDTIMTTSEKDLIKIKPKNAFIRDYMADVFKTRYYHYIVKIKPQHLKLNRYAISKLYSYSGDYNERKR